MRTRFKMDFLTTQESIDNLLLESTFNLYIFFYDDRLKLKQRDIYENNIKLLIKLYENSCTQDTNDACKSKFVIVDMGLHPQAKDAHEIKIMWYKNKQLQSANLLKDESRKNSSQNNFTGI